MSRTPRIRILAVIDSLGPGGAEHSLADTLERIGAYGVDAEVVCRYRSESHVAQRLTASGVEVTTMPDPSPLAAARWLRSHVRSTSPSLLHLSLFMPTMLGTWGTIGCGVPIVVSIVTTKETGDPSVPPWKRRLVREAEGLACRRRSSVVHAVTSGVAESVHRDLRVDRDKIRVVERGRDATRFRPARRGERDDLRRRLGVQPGTELVVAVGRHEYAKGFGILLDAVGRLQERRNDFVVLIAGRSGAHTADIEQRVAELSRPDGVRLLGDRNDVDEILRAADVFVMSSRREGAAGALIEAMATRLPIVATDLVGTAGVVHHEHDALLVAPGDPAALADAIDRLLDQPSLARSLANAAHDTFAERFGMDISVAAMADLYRSVVDSSTSGRARHRRGGQQ